MKWSLKKKLLVGAAAGVAGVVSIIAYGKSKQSDSVDDMYEEDDDNEQFLDAEEQDRQAELGDDMYEDDDDNEQFLDAEEQDRQAELGDDETETEK